MKFAMTFLMVLVLAGVANAAPTVAFTSDIYAGTGVDFGPTGETVTGVVDFATGDFGFSTNNSDGAKVLFSLTMDEGDLTAACDELTCVFKSQQDDIFPLPIGGEVMFWGLGMDTPNPEVQDMVGTFWDTRVGFETVLFGGQFQTVSTPEPAAGLFSLIGAAFLLVGLSSLRRR